MLPLYQDPEHEALWRQNPDLYRVFTRRLISEGNPTRAFDIAREGLAAHADDHELKYLLALALARGGNLRGAEKYLADLLQQSELEAKLRVEALSLEGRLFKDRYERTREAGRKAELAARSAASYRAAAEVPGADSFPRINAATMTFLSGDNPPARELAKSVLDQIQQELQKTDGPEDYWKLASLGEACLILERFDDAAAWYGKAVATAGERRDIGSIAAMARTRRPPRRRKARLPQPGSGGNGTSSPCCLPTSRSARSSNGGTRGEKRPKPARKPNSYGGLGKPLQILSETSQMVLTVGSLPIQPDEGYQPLQSQSPSPDCLP